MVSWQAWQTTRVLRRRFAMSAAHASVSLNQSVGADDEGELGDLFADREAVDPFDEAEESLRRQGVRRALDALPERERRILELRFGDDLTVPEIAKILQLSESAAESRLSRARQAFRERWNGEASDALREQS